MRRTRRGFGQGRRGSGRALGRLAARREEIWAPEVPAITACPLTAPPAETDGIRASPAWGDATEGVEIDQKGGGGGGLDGNWISFLFPLFCR